MEHTNQATSTHDGKKWYDYENCELRNFQKNDHFIRIKGDNQHRNSIHLTACIPDKAKTVAKSVHFTLIRTV